MAGMTLRFARSPEAPKRTTVQGSDAPPYTEPKRPVSPAIVSSSIKLRPVQEPVAASQTIPQPHTFQAPGAIAPRSDGEWCSSPGAAGFPGSAAGHQRKDTAPACAV